MRKAVTLAGVTAVLAGLLTGVSSTSSFAAGGPALDTKTTAFSATGTATASVSTAVAGDLVVAFVSGDDPGTPAQSATVSSTGLTWTLAKRVNGQPGTFGNLVGVRHGDPQRRGRDGDPCPDRRLRNEDRAGGGNVLERGGHRCRRRNKCLGGSALREAHHHRSRTLGYTAWDSTGTRGSLRTVGSGQTLVDQVLQTGGTFWTQSQTSLTASSGTSVTINDTAPTTDVWDLALAEILAAGGAAAPVISNVAATASPLRGRPSTGRPISHPRRW